MNKELDKKLAGLVQDLTPSMELEFWSAGRKLYHFKLGRKQKYYDLASLTKILFTVPAFMELVQESGLKLKSSVTKVLPWYRHPEVSLFDLLTHTSGLVWWQALGEGFTEEHSFEERWWEVKRALRHAPLKKNQGAVYSDMGFILLAMILEELYQKPLVFIWEDLKARLFPNTQLHFNPFNKNIERTDYAPTGLSSHRKLRLQGRVHDENCYSFGGVSTHAGLFGRSEDVSLVGNHFLNGYNQSTPVLHSETLRRFARRALPEATGDWGLGFMKPTPGSASCGSYFSPDSFGHLGFTGCSLWVDPQNKWVISIVSNRVYFGLDKRFASLRGTIHNHVIENILGVK